MRKKYFKNPVISGFHPDSSVCRCGDIYYLVVSSMEYFPGIPVFTSQDLIHWKRIGAVLDSPDALDLSGCEASGGIMAPTIRYWNGVFYVTYSCEGNGYVCTTRNPQSGWDLPVLLKNTHGIDNSLFFDEDGSCYYHENRKNPDGERFLGDRVIWAQKFDIEKLCLIGEQRIIYQGDGGTYCEAPHIYKKDKWYYLICAEDGTFRNHSVVCARAETIWGPYESCPRNPLLTSRHLSREYPIQNAGHLEMIETQNGEWWAFVLGSRPYGGYDDSQEKDENGGYFRNLGRETFLIPMCWERGWPVFCPDSGKIELRYMMPRLEEEAVEIPESAWWFGEKKELDQEWTFLRTPKERWYQLNDQGLRMQVRKETLKERSNPSFIGIRQKHFSFTVTCHIEFHPEKEEEEAGVVLLQNRFAYLACVITRRKDQLVCMVTCSLFGNDVIEGQCPVETGKGVFRISAVEQRANIYFRPDSEKEYIVAENVSLRTLNSDTTGSHTGNFIGMYASSNHVESGKEVTYRYFTYNGEDEAGE